VLWCGAACCNVFQYDTSAVLSASVFGVSQKGSFSFESLSLSLLFSLCFVLRESLSLSSLFLFRSLFVSFFSLCVCACMRVCVCVRESVCAKFSVLECLL